MVFLKTSAQCMIICGLLFEILATLWSVALAIRAGIFQFDVYDECSDLDVYEKHIFALRSQSPTIKYFAYSLDEDEGNLRLISKYETLNESTSSEFPIFQEYGYEDFKKRCTCNNMDNDVLVRSYYDSSIEYLVKSCSGSACTGNNINSISCTGVEGNRGDGFCDSDMNEIGCDYDEGDCCRSSNINGTSFDCLDPSAEENLPSEFSGYVVDEKFEVSNFDECWFLIPNGIAIVIVVSIVSSLFIEIFECYFEYIHISQKDTGTRLKIFIVFLEVSSVVAVGAAVLAMDNFLTPGINHAYSYHSIAMLTLVVASFFFGLIGLIFQVLFIYGKGSKFLDPVGNGMIWFSSGCLEAVITLFSKWRSENSDKFSVISSEIFSFVALEILAVVFVTWGRVAWIKFKNRKVLQDDFPKKNNKFEMNMMEEAESGILDYPIITRKKPDIIDYPIIKLEEIFDDSGKEIVGTNPSRKKPEIIDYPIRKDRFIKLEEIFDDSGKEIVGTNPSRKKPEIIN